MFHPSRRKRSAATSASPALLPFPANTMHLPGLRKNLVTACATPAPALSISASTSTPRAKAASSAARICVEVRTGRFNYPSRSFEPAFASDPPDLDELFFRRALFLCERLDRPLFDFATL